MDTFVDLIDREIERKKVFGFFEKHLSDKRVLILHSPPGVGKSCLVDHVASKVKKRFTYIVVGNGTRYDGTSYIQQFAMALNDVAIQTGEFPSIPQFLMYFRKDLALASLGSLKALPSLVADISHLNFSATFFTNTITWLGDYFKHANDHKKNAADITRVNSTDAMAFCEGYIKYVMSKITLVLRLNRYDEIDEASDLLLGHIYNNAKQIMLLLEVSSGSSIREENQVIQRASHRFPGAMNGYMPIGPIDSSYIIGRYAQVLRDRDFDVDAFLKETYEQSSGDFNKFRFLLEEKAGNPSFDSTFSTKEALYSAVRIMPKAAKQITALLIASQKRINIAKIKEFFVSKTHFNENEHERAIEYISKKCSSFIIIDGDDISVVDDWFRELLRSCDYLELYLTIAESYLLRYFRNALGSAVGPDEQHSYLLAIISLVAEGGECSDSGIIITALRELNVHGYPMNGGELYKVLNKLFVNYVVRHRRLLNVNHHARECDVIYEEICKLMYRLGYYDELDKVYSSYAEFYPLENHSDALRLSIISAKIIAGKAESIDLIECISAKNYDLYIGSRLLLVMYYRVFDMPWRAKKEWRALKKSKKLIGSKYEGLLYEYGALTCPVNIFKKIFLLRRAREVHNKLGNIFHSVQCGVGAASTYLYVPFFRRWRVRRAEGEMQSIGLFSSKLRIMDHVLENQNAILDMHRKRITEDTLERLMHAYEKCPIAADKLLIGSNLINCFLILKHANASVPDIDAYAKDILRISGIYQRKASEYARYALLACSRYSAEMDDRVMRRELEAADISTMSIHLGFANLGVPRTPVCQILSRNVYRRLYHALWPRILPVYIWSTDFHSIYENYTPKG